MADTAANSHDSAFLLARTLAEHMAQDVVVMDVAAQAGWTDYFVVATATSATHLRGLLRFVDEALPAAGLERLNRPSVAEDEEWILFDLGSVVVHLMLERARTFYELEKLWFQSPAVGVAAPQLAQSME